MKQLNCLIVDDEPLARKGLKDFAEQLDLNVVGEAKNAEQAMHYLSKNKLDILFLDIEMPGMSGIELLESLPSRPAVIMTTAFQNYALKGFDLEVQDYLLKPISFERFQKGVRKASEYLSYKVKKEMANHSEEHVFLRSEGKLYKLKIEEILYIQALQNYVQCFTKERRYISHITMKAMEEQLPDSLFVRIHKSYLINTLNLGKIDGNEVEVAGQNLPISRNYKESAYKKILKDQLISR